MLLELDQDEICLKEYVPAGVLFGSIGIVLLNFGGPRGPSTMRSGMSDRK